MRQEIPGLEVTSYKNFKLQCASFINATEIPLIFFFFKNKNLMFNIGSVFDFVSGADFKYLAAVDTAIL